MRQSKYSLGVLKWWIAGVFVTLQSGRHFLFFFWPPCCARRISVDVEGINFVNSMQVHAALREQVLTPWFIACDLLAAQVIQSSLAIIKVCHVCGCGIVAYDLKAAEEAVVHILAILKVDAVLGHREVTSFQVFSEPRGEEHSVNISLPDRISP